MSGVYLGVDAGNSKTVALLCTPAGEIVGWGRAGVGDIYAAAGAECALGEVGEAVPSALRHAGVGPADVRHAAFRLAGVDWPEDAEFWRRALDSRLPGLGSPSVKNDGFSLLRYASASGTGVALVAGTGPAIAARGTTGQEFSGSFWIQESLGGHGLGRDAFRAVIRSHLGLAPPTALTDRLLALYDLRDVPQLLHAFTRRTGALPASHRERAGRIVLMQASEGDDAAAAIVRQHARSFAEYAGVAARAVGLSPDRRPVDAEPSGNAVDVVLGGHAVDVVLGGSLLASEHGILRETVVAELGAVLARPHVLLAPGSPAVGTLLDALAEGGVALSGRVRARLARTLLPPDLLAT